MSKWQKHALKWLYPCKNTKNQGFTEKYRFVKKSSENLFNVAQ